MYSIYDFKVVNFEINPFQHVILQILWLHK